MRKVRVMKLLICTALLLSACSVSPIETWRAFFGQPDDEHRLQAVQALIASTPEMCGSITGLENADRARLYALVASGNERAFQVGLRIKKCLDGGELEDMLIGIGSFLERKPEAFLLGVSQTQQSTVQFGDMLRAMPLDLSDDTNGMIMLVRRRRESVSTVARQDLSQLRARAIDILAAYEAKLSGN